jgi:hypothetical protein
MEFVQSVLDENYTLTKFVSTGGGWEMGHVRMLFGVRIRVSRTGAGWCNVDYCAADSPLHQILIFEAVRTILRKVPEDIDDRTLEEMFPKYTVKPIQRDETCFAELTALAMRIKEELDGSPEAAVA